MCKPWDTLHKNISRSLSHETNPGRSKDTTLTHARPTCTTHMLTHICHIYTSFLRLRSHNTGQLFVPTRKALQYSVNSNGAELEQIVHTHRTSCHSGWPRGLGELNASPHSFTFRYSSPLAVGDMGTRLHRIFSEWSTKLRGCKSVPWVLKFPALHYQETGSCRDKVHHRWTVRTKRRRRRNFAPNLSAS